MPDEFCHRSSAQVQAGGGGWLAIADGGGREGGRLEEPAAWQAAVTFNT